ncbi:hypothetical protein ACFLT7_00130 [candidate division KSB1 bacterium]
MRTRGFTLIMVLLPVVLGLMVGCGEDEEVESDPYTILAGGDNNRWKNRTVDENDVVVTINLKLTAAKTYTRNQDGTSGGEPVDSYTEAEAGNYSATDTEIVFTPTGGTAYTVSWQSLPGTGDLEFTYTDGTVVVFTYEPYSGNEY